MSWVDYWNSAPSVYVSDRHKDAHYQAVADDIVAHLPRRGLCVLDFGCGEALHADRLASSCRELLLFDAAPRVAESVKERFREVKNIRVVSGEDLSRPDAQESIDFIVVNSVLQYLNAEQLADCARTWTRILRPDGAILFADIIPGHVGPVADATALLAFAARRGFLTAAFIGLIRTFFSDYRKTRASLGFATYDEFAFIALMRRHAFEVHRVRPNLGHNQARMAFLGRRHA